MMEKYEILSIVITISTLGVGFKITFEDLDVFKLFKVKHLKLTFDSSDHRKLLHKAYLDIKQYQSHTIPTIPESQLTN